MRFTNGVVKKEFSKIKNYLWIGVLLIILSFVFLYSYITLYKYICQAIFFIIFLSHS